MTTTEQAKQVSLNVRKITFSNNPELFIGISDTIDALVAENDRLREALKDLLQDTQHAEHEDCEDGPCPVREARAVLKGES